VALAICDAHRHLGALPAWPFYGGPAVQPATRQQGTIAGLLRDLDDEGTERAVVLPNYGVPDPDAAFAFNEPTTGSAAPSGFRPAPATTPAPRRPSPSPVRPGWSPSS